LNFLGFASFDFMKQEQALEGELDNDSRVRLLVHERDAARARKDWKESDRIRDQLAKMGVVLKDTKDPQTGEPKTTWEIAR
jgi:cysteinyl-tRNA synthetase